MLFSCHFSVRDFSVADPLLGFPQKLVSIRGFTPSLASLPSLSSVEALNLELLWRHHEGCVSCVVLILELGIWNFFPSLPFLLRFRPGPFNNAAAMTAAEFKKKWSRLLEKGS
jgi:hypothetical protein